METLQSKKLWEIHLVWHRQLKAWPPCSQTRDFPSTSQSVAVTTVQLLRLYNITVVFNIPVFCLSCVLLQVVILRTVFFILLLLFCVLFFVSWGSPYAAQASHEFLGQSLLPQPHKNLVPSCISIYPAIFSVFLKKYGSLSWFFCLFDCLFFKSISIQTIE